MAAAEGYTGVKIFLAECFHRRVVSYSQLNHQKDLMRVMRNLGPGANDPCPKSLASYNDFLYTFSYIRIRTNLLK